jgi:hypothetical protein
MTGQFNISIVDQLAELADTEGRSGVERWIKDRIPELTSSPSHIEHIYQGLRQRSVGSAFLFARLLPKDILPQPAESDIAEKRKSSPGLWVTGVASILSPTILARVRFALENGDILCGLQRHYCAGCGPSAVVFTSFEAFQAHIRGTRPGDEFMLLSIHRLSAENRLLPPTLGSVKDYLAQNPRDEVLLVTAGGESPTVEFLWAGRDEEEDITSFFEETKALYAVPMEWEQEFFIDAKRPNDAGEIPLGGAY